MEWEEDLLARLMASADFGHQVLMIVCTRYKVCKYHVCVEVAGDHLPNMTYTEWKGNKCHPLNSRRGRLKGPKNIYTIRGLNLIVFS